MGKMLIGLIVVAIIIWVFWITGFQMIKSWIKWSTKKEEED